MLGFSSECFHFHQHISSARSSSRWLRHELLESFNSLHGNPDVTLNASHTRSHPFSSAPLILVSKPCSSPRRLQQMAHKKSRREYIFYDFHKANNNEFHCFTSFVSFISLSLSTSPCRVNTSPGLLQNI